MITAASNDRRDGYLSLREGEEEQEESLDFPIEREPARFMV